MVVVFFALALSSLFGLTLEASSCEWEKPKPPKLGGVSSLDARCSRIGVDVLKKGGNAADAVGGDPRVRVTPRELTKDVPE
jgi:hypothetical protein